MKGKNYFHNNLTIKKITNLDVLNCYQSEYAQYFLNKNGFKEILPLTDFINDSFLSYKNSNVKENVILYNPKKGFEFTKKLMEEAPHYKWVALENMNREEINNFLQTSKIYIDFGHFPGKDRIPREAVVNGCCIITGFKGAAKFFEDVSIPNRYKIQQGDKNIKQIINLIDDIFTNYEDRFKDFDFYKSQIAKEKRLFFEQVETIFTKFYE